MSKKVVIVGAGGHAKVIADIVLCSGDDLIGFLDDNELKQKKIVYKNYEVIGKISDYLKYKDYSFIVAIGDNYRRAKISKELKVNWYTAIHPNAVVADTVKVGVGTVIMAGVIINPDTIIGEHCIINTGATVDHDNVISNFVHISPGAHLAGSVKIGECSWVGAGAVVVNNINIGKKITLGAGGVAIKSLLENNNTYIGIPAKKR